MEKEIEVRLPKLGESIVSAIVVQWFKKEGDFVKLDEPLLEVSTDKVNSEIPSPVTGRIKTILAQVDDEIDVGASLATISTSEKASCHQATIDEKKDVAPQKKMKGFFSPLVLNLAREKGISLEELESIPATGAGGRVSKRDLEAYLERKHTPSSASNDIECLKMSTTRKMIAENMVRSFYEAPHASLVHQVDVTNIVTYIKKHKENFLKQNHYKLSITSFIAKAIAQAIKEYPLINASLEKDTIMLKHFVNLGIAVSVEQGIIVPVIRHCQTRSIRDIAKAVADFSEKARQSQLNPQDVKEGTITMTNFGMTGTLIGIPIIRYPEVAVIGVGAIQRQVVSLENETIGVRSIMHLSLTFDHRIIDGMYGCGFLASVKSHLEHQVDIDLI